MKVNMSSEIMYKLEQIIRLNFPQVDFSFKNMEFDPVSANLRISYIMYNNYYYLAFDTDLPPNFSVYMSIDKETSCSFDDNYLIYFSDIIIQKILAKIREINNI